MSAQSFDSVPPAPDWIERMALFDRGVEFLGVRLALGAVGRLDQFHHHRHVVHAFLEGDDRQHRPLEGVQLGDVLLRPLVVVPEPRRAHLGVHRLDLALLLIDVKETSTSARRAW